MDRTRISLAAASALAMIAGAQAAVRQITGVPDGTRGIDRIAEDQRRAAQRRSQGKRVVRAAMGELQQAASNTIVLGHIHPRWLRAEVSRRMDLGEAVTAETIEQIRSAGR